VDEGHLLFEDLPLEGSYSFLALETTESTKGKPDESSCAEKITQPLEEPGWAMLPLVPGDWQPTPDLAPATHVFAELLLNALGEKAKSLPLEQVRVAVRAVKSCRDLTLTETRGILPSPQGHFIPFMLAWLTVPYADTLSVVAAVPVKGLLSGLALDLSVETKRSDDSIREWTALFIAFEPGNNGPRRPIGAEDPLPLLPDASLPPTAWREEDWRRWAVRPLPQGMVVELPWLEGRRLVRGRVLVTPNGVNCEVLSEEIIADNLPVFVEHWVGPLRLLTPPD
jgi:hypothetical protein